MFNTNEHILHLYECIDELRDELHHIRMRQNNTPTHVPSFYNPDILTSPLSSRDPPIQNTTSTGLNWSVELENDRNIIDDIYLGLPPRRPSSTVRNTGSSRRNTGGNSVNSRNRVNRQSTTSNRLTPPSNPTVTTSTPNSVGLTFYEPRISSVRERLDTLLDSLRRDYNLPPIDETGSASGSAPRASRATSRATARARTGTGTASNTPYTSVNLDNLVDTTLGLGINLGSGSNLGDDHARRLTLAEINTGCETKIHSGEEETCSICREPINETSIVREIKNCRHKFHQLCLDTWLENRRTCPICRGEVCLSANTAAERAASAATGASATDSVVNDLD